MSFIGQTAYRYISRLKGELAFALARTFVARGIGALGSVVLFIVIGRLYGAAGVGVFAIAQALLLTITHVAERGMKGALVRFVGRDIASPHVTRYLRWACAGTLSLSLVAAAITYMSREGLEHLFNADGLAPVLASMAVGMPAIALSMILSGFMNAVRKHAAGSLLENGFTALIASPVVLILHWIWPEAGIAMVGFAFALAGWLVFAQGAWQTWRWLAQQRVVTAGSGPITRAHFMQSSNAFFVIGMVGMTPRILAVVIAGYYLSSAELGQYKAALQLGMLIGFVHTVINNVFPPRFAALFHQNNMKALAKLAQQGAILGSLLGAPLLAVCLLAPDLLLGLFGSGFSGAANLLIIIAVAQFIDALAGLGGYLLNMTGHVRVSRNIALVCNGLGFALFFVATPVFGATGAAAVTAFILIAQTLVDTLFVWRRLGIWPMPTPNICRLLGIRPIQRPA